MSSTTFTSPAQDLMVVAGIASLLARQGTPGLPAALQTLDRHVGGASTVRLPAGGRGALPQPRLAETDRLEFPLYQGTRLLGWLSAAGLVPPYHLEVLTAVADVLALTLTAPRPDLLDALVLDVDTDRDVLADELHDGVAQALVAARYAADLAARGLRARPTADSAAVVELDQARAAVQDALISLRRTIWWQRGRCGTSLLSILLALADQQRSAGAAELRIAILPAAAAAHAPAGRRGPSLPAGADVTWGLRPAVTVTAYRCVQEVLRSHGGPVSLLLRRTEGLLTLELRSGRGAELAGSARWARQVEALGGQFTATGGRLRLSLPAEGGSARDLSADL